jgi:hypothetical protein
MLCAHDENKARTCEWSQEANLLLFVWLGRKVRSVRMRLSKEDLILIFDGGDGT